MFLHRLKSYQIIVIIINQKVGFHFRLNLTGKPSMHQIPTEHAALSFKKKKSHTHKHSSLTAQCEQVQKPSSLIPVRSHQIRDLTIHAATEAPQGDLCYWMNEELFFFFLYMLMFAPPRLCVCVISLHNPGITIWIFLALGPLGLCCSPPSRLCEYEEWDWTPGVWSIW